jgi:hypothetical protein
MRYSRYRPPRHAVRRGIQRGTLMRNASYSAPNDFFWRRLFVAHDKQVAEEPEDRAVGEQPPIAEQDRLAENDGGDRHVDWIAHISIEAGNDEMLGRGDRRRRAEPPRAPSCAATAARN